jgi:hypothetical protein
MEKSEWRKNLKTELRQGLKELRESWNQAVAQSKVIVPYKRMFRFALLFSAITAIFLFGWQFFNGPIASFSEIPNLKDGYIDLSFDVSYWWSVPYFGLLSAFVVYFFSQKNIVITWKDAAFIFLVMPALLIPALFLGYGVGAADSFLFNLTLRMPPGLMRAEIIVSFIISFIVFLCLKPFSIFDFEKGRFALSLMVCSGIIFTTIGFCGGVVLAEPSSSSYSGIAGVGIVSALFYPMIILGCTIPCVYIFIMGAVFLALGPIISALFLLYKAIKSILSWAMAR